MNHPFQDLASVLTGQDVTAEAIEDGRGRVCALRLYTMGVAYEIRPGLVEGERLRLASVDGEAAEPEAPVQRVESVDSRSVRGK